MNAHHNDGRFSLEHFPSMLSFLRGKFCCWLCLRVAACLLPLWGNYVRMQILLHRALPGATDTLPLWGRN